MSGWYSINEDKINVVMRDGSRHEVDIFYRYVYDTPGDLGVDVSLTEPEDEGIIIFYSYTTLSERYMEIYGTVRDMDDDDADAILFKGSKKKVYDTLTSGADINSTYLWKLFKKYDEDNIINDIDMFEDTLRGSGAGDLKTVLKYYANGNSESMSSYLRNRREWWMSLPERHVLEKAIVNDPKESYYYAVYALERRFPEGEPAIAKDPEYAFRYAKYVVKGRWPEGEPVIAKNPEWAYYYVDDIIKSRWPEGESAIARCAPREVLKYAKLINSRFPLGEKSILKTPASACEYAIDIINGRWPEAEAVIAKDNYYQQIYRNFLHDIEVRDRRNAARREKRRLAKNVR